MLQRQASRHSGEGHVGRRFEERGRERERADEQAPRASDEWNARRIDQRNDGIRVGTVRRIGVQLYNRSR